MASRKLSFRLHRRIQKSQLQVENLGTQASGHIERHIISRLGRLMRVRSFIITWLGILLLLMGTDVAQIGALHTYYQTLEPINGGTYTEGILGDFTTANPLFASNPVDSSVARLIFGSLLTYNDHNQLVPDLAQKWSVDTSGKVYTVVLKPHLKWQDGQSLTASDVVFTYKMIQDPATQSPLYESWQHVTVAALNSQTITFTLNSALASFPYSLTNGLLPEHLLLTISPDQLRTTAFNTSPIGSGPFTWENLAAQGDTPQSRQEQINLVANKNFYAGAPKLNAFVIRAFHDSKTMVTAFTHNELDGMAGLNSVPSQLNRKHAVQALSLPLTAANMVFFKNSNPVLNDVQVRQALVKSANVPNIINSLGYPVIQVQEPFLYNQLGFNPKLVQAGFDQTGAENQLQSDGWILGKANIRYKAGSPLSFRLFAADDNDSHKVGQALEQQWRKVGANVQVVYQDTNTLQNTLAFHTYDALLYGISIGVDPDVFVYWDSSQINPRTGTRLNFSEYNSPSADTSLEAGRTRLDPSLRNLKYQPFLQAWQKDAPALGLYQPRFLYITQHAIFGLTEHPINQDTDRYSNVQNWAVRQGFVTD